MNAAVYPRLTEQVARNDRLGLACTYQRSCEWMAAVIVPPGLMLAVFAEPALLLWTGDRALSSAVAPILALLALGTLFNGLMNLPYMLQLAHGWTRISVQCNAVAVLVMVPAMAWAVPRFGPAGAAFAWMTLNLAYVLVIGRLIHKRLLPAANRSWYLNAVARPLLAGSLPALAIYAIGPVAGSRLHAALVLAAAGVVTTGCVAASLPTVRESIRRALGAAPRATSL
jgi:O-antigen/teichoic acid export membrane protein